MACRKRAATVFPAVHEGVGPTRGERAISAGTCESEPQLMKLRRCGTPSITASPSQSSSTRSTISLSINVCLACVLMSRPY